MKRVLVIGGQSMVGKALGEALRSKYLVTLASRRGTEFKVELGSGFDPEVIEGRFDIIVNTAAHFDTDRSSDLLQCAEVNAIGALQACMAAEKFRATHVIHVSSVSAKADPSERAYNAYSLTKRQGEELCTHFCRTRDLGLTILRPSQLYDAAGFGRKHQKMLYSIMEKASTSEDFTIFGTHDALRNYLFLPDFVEVCKRVIESHIEGLFDVVHPHSPRLSEVAATAYGVFGTQGRICFDPTRPDLEDLVVSPDLRLADTIGYMPQTSLAEGMALYRKFREQEA